MQEHWAENYQEAERSLHSKREQYGKLLLLGEEMSDRIIKSQSHIQQTNKRKVFLTMLISLQF